MDVDTERYLVQYLSTVPGTILSYGTGFYIGHFVFCYVGRYLRKYLLYRYIEAFLLWDLPECFVNRAFFVGISQLWPD